MLWVENKETDRKKVMWKSKKHRLYNKKGCFVNLFLFSEKFSFKLTVRKNRKVKFFKIIQSPLTWIL